MFLRTPYNYNTMQASDESGLLCEDKSLAQQNQKDEADINNILRKFGLTGELPNNNRTPTYGDFTGITDYRSALHAVMQAETEFSKLNAEIRARFQNDPEQLLLFLENESNKDEAIKLGLIANIEQVGSDGSIPPSETARQASKEPPAAKLPL
ncbi:MAG: internal scaffolding protein [Microvirus sp.]|nr:MAG: internal scaffolding protein [Microvirus sp.]